MALGGDLLSRIEAAAVKAWPALETAEIGGWLWRYSNGGSQRANSVSAAAFDANDVEAAIEEAERRYGMRRAATRVQVSAVSAPADLDDRLAARGYHRHDPSVTLAKPVAPDVVLTARVTLAPEPSAEWFALYASVLTADRRSAAPAFWRGSRLRVPSLLCTGPKGLFRPPWEWPTAISVPSSAWQPWRTLVGKAALRKRWRESRAGLAARDAAGSICRRP
jgi:hypothetical protein